MNKRKFFIQGITLTLISLSLRTMNIWFRSFLTEKIGPEGLGLYQLIFSVFTLAVTLTTSGISLAVTRMVTSALNKNERSKVVSLVHRCMLFCLILSTSVAVILYSSSDFCARTFLGTASAAPSLRMLALGLPFISLSTCLKGYFLAMEKGVTGSIGEFLEEILTLSLTVVIFNLGSLHSLETACAGAMLAASAGEVISFLWNYCCYRVNIFRSPELKGAGSSGVIKGLLHIALPCTLSAVARSLLSTAENLLIPARLQLGGFDFNSAMSAYGILCGMALPLLYFPSSLLFSFGFLMIPKLSTEYELGHRRHVAYMTGRAIFTGLSFGVICGLMFYSFSRELGLVFYKSEAAGSYIRLLAPLTPLIFLDVIMASLLNGLDQQLSSMKYNIIDSALRVILVLLLLHRFGIGSYVAIMYFSAIFNGSLSLYKLIKVSEMDLSPVKNLLLEIPAAVLAVWAAGKLSFANIYLELFLRILTAMTIYIFAGAIFSTKKNSPEPSGPRLKIFG